MLNPAPVLGPWFWKHGPPQMQLCGWKQQMFDNQQPSSASSSSDWGVQTLCHGSGTISSLERLQCIVGNEEGIFSCHQILPNKCRTLTLPPHMETHVLDADDPEMHPMGGRETAAAQTPLMFGQWGRG